MMNNAEKFATRWKFRYISKFSLYNENFAIIAKFRYVVKILFVENLSALVFVFKLTPFWFFSFLPSLLFCCFILFCNFPFSEHI